MKDISILIGGKAGDGIDSAGFVIAHILNQLGYYIYVYRDYPSLIRGGHTFSIIRASSKKIGVHKDSIDFLIALNQDTVDLHKKRLTKKSVIFYDSDSVKAKGIGIPLTCMAKEENAPIITRNTGALGVLSKALSIDWKILEKVLRKNISKEIDLNLKIAKRGYDATQELLKIKKIKKSALPLLTGNEAISLGLIKGGLKAYVAYPMTPATSILHFLAGEADNFSLKVIHPENEIAVIIMALGLAYTGGKVAVGTSGGGFCLMTEGLSLAGMSESPIVIVMSQRSGPASGVPTYSAQADLQFVLGAGHGDFLRLVVAPGDAEEAYKWSVISLNLSWKYQLPSLILVDKTLSEGTYSFDIKKVGKLKEEKPLLWSRKGDYRRYLNTKTGVSPLAFPSDKKAIINTTSYEHDEYGITTEKSDVVEKIQDKRLRKESYLIGDIEKQKAVNVFGNKKSSTALLCWGSNKGVCFEVAQGLGIKAIQPIVLSPFPKKQLKEALKGVRRLLSVENNSTGQMAKLVDTYGFKVDKKILKYDGRPFSKENLEKRLRGVKI